MDNKQKAAQAVIQEIQSDQMVGIGTGSTVDGLIDLLPGITEGPSFYVASSERSAQRLRSLGLEVRSLNEVGSLDLYIDGADQLTKSGVSLKGGGGCHTLEKLLATHSKRFIGIATKDKLVQSLSAPVTVEVLEVARSAVARAIVGLGGEPKYREGFVTDSGHCILDVFGLNLADPERVERTLTALVGVLEVGIFALRRFDGFYLADDNGVEKY